MSKPIFARDTKISVLQKIRRWVIYPISIVAIVIGIAGYVFSAYSANQLKIEVTTGFNALDPSEVYWDLVHAVLNLEKYIEYKETGQVVIYGALSQKTYSSVRLLAYIPSYRDPNNQPGELAVFVPAMYHNQPPALLRDVLKNFKTRRDIALIQRQAAEIYWTLLVAGGATGLFFLLLPVVIRFGRRILLSRISSACVTSWRKLMVLGSIVWAVLATWETNPHYSSDYAIIVGPFLIAFAIYFLFPGKKTYPYGNTGDDRIDGTQDRRK